MGLYGAIIVLPDRSDPGSLHAPGCAACEPWLREAHWGEADFRLAAAAYDHAKSCYDREYLFQFSEMDPNIHSQALAQVTATGRLRGRGCRAAAWRCRPSRTTPRTS